MAFGGEKMTAKTSIVFRLPFASSPQFITEMLPSLLNEYTA